MTYQVHHRHPIVKGTIDLAGSKSISNRALIIQALTNDPFQINRLANANDTELMFNLLRDNNPVKDAGPAGTTFRFLTAFLSLQPGDQILTGTERMKKRPIGILVDALRQLGGQIEYLEKEGFPPLRVGAPDPKKGVKELKIAAHTSSQYISALLMIAPTLPNGLTLTLEGKIVSRPYIEMTLALMKYFGVQHHWEDQSIVIAPQSYQARTFTVEADWSAASYYYAIAAIALEADIYLKGLFENSVQGDAVIREMMNSFGVTTHFHSDGIQIVKPKDATVTPKFDWDFIKCPDLAQTMAVICAAQGVEGHFKGLETLKIKETDRIVALQTELAKVNVQMKNAPDNELDQMITGQIDLSKFPPTFPTYEDHRMAMAFAPLALKGPINIEEPMVVNKSYPLFWEDLKKLGFIVKETAFKTES